MRFTRSTVMLFGVGVAITLASVAARERHEGQGPVGPRGVGLRIVDSVGQDVGAYHWVNSWVFRQIGDSWLVLPVGPQGFPDGGIQFMHTSGDCSGPRYVQSGGSDNPFYDGAFIFGTVAVYPLNSERRQGIRSIETIDRGGDLEQPGRCAQANPDLSWRIGEMATFDLSKLGLVPPFHLEDRY